MSKFFDAHCDTAYECFQNKESILKNSLHLDLERMQKYEEYIQVFAAFVDQKNIKISPFKHCMDILQHLQKEILQNQDVISVITNATELRISKKNGKIGAILAIEGGEALEGSLANLLSFYDFGVRLITLTWNYANEISDGIMAEYGRGLTGFGVQAIHAMEDLGIVIDVSHLAERGFWDVAKHTKFPFVASHSNARALCDHPRNLSDDQILFIAERNGCIGINFYPVFLSENEHAGIADIYRHIEYIKTLSGEDCIGFGSDFDGVSSLPSGISGIESMDNVLNFLQQRGYAASLLEKICFGNFYRIFHQAFSRRK